MVEESYTFTPVDLDMFIDDYAEQDVEEEEEEGKIEMQFVKNAIDFRDVKLRECIVPRPEVNALEQNDSIDNLRKQFIESGFSRIPIFKEDIDEIIGYCHASDLFTQPDSIKSIIREIDFYPETILAKEVLKKLIHKGQSIAVVVDEWGGTSGIVTIEDIIEEIFGEIEDEFDENALVEEYLEKDKCYLLSTRLEIDYLNEKYKFEIPESDAYETLGGFIISHSEKIPDVDERLEIENFSIQVKKASPAMLELVCLSNNNPNPEK
jgi:CBS domain containing-hemolysin-like protein